MKLAGIDFNDVATWITTGFIVLSFVLAGGANVVETLSEANLLFFVPAGVLIILSGFLRAFKSYFLISSGAKTGYDYTQNAFPEEPGLMDAAMDPLRKRIGKTLGKGIVFISKSIDYWLKGVAGLFGLLFAISLGFNGNLPSYFFVGAWFILSVISIILFKKLIDFFAGAEASFNFFGYNFTFLGFSGKAEKAFFTVNGISLLAWFVETIGLFGLLNAFGASFSLSGLFLLTGLFFFFSLIPGTFHGFGLTELIGMPLIASNGSALAAGFLALISWDLIKLLSEFLASRSLSSYLGKSLNVF